MVLRYVTHPEVHVDPAVAVESWHLGERGRARAVAMLAQPWIRDVRRIVSSAETKALEMAELLAGHLGLEVEVRPDTGEIDRSAAGFLPPGEFEAVADACFADPSVSARGWERAVDAQARVAGALADLVTDPGGDVVIVGHGGVGTFWYCHLAGVPIARRLDQPGQGHYFTVEDGRPIHHWRPIDAPDEHT